MPLVSSVDGKEYQSQLLVDGKLPVVFSNLRTGPKIFTAEEEI